MNPMNLFQIQNAWKQFQQNHPKFPLFLNAVAREGIREGSVIEIKITSPEGREYDTNVKVSQSDLQLMELLKGLK